MEDWMIRPWVEMHGSIEYNLRKLRLIDNEDVQSGKLPLDRWCSRWSHVCLSLFSVNNFFLDVRLAYLPFNKYRYTLSSRDHIESMATAAPQIVELPCSAYPNWFYSVPHGGYSLERPSSAIISMSDAQLLVVQSSDYPWHTRTNTRSDRL